MTYRALIGLIDGMASDFLFLDNRDIDIPSAGKFLNCLDQILAEGEKVDTVQIIRVSRALSHILGKWLVEQVKDKEAGFAMIENGISLMQEVAASYKNTGAYAGDLSPFVAGCVDLLGEDIPSMACFSDTTGPVKGGAAVEKPEAGRDEAAASADSLQDDSLLKDFIIEASEYIDEIEVNILNLEQEPENKDYINAIFRPFHSIKGVASFLNLDVIRDLAHKLENLLDKARNAELDVTPSVIDVVLDGADALKILVGQLRTEPENSGTIPEGLDLEGLKNRVQMVEEGRADIPVKKRLGEILLEDGVINQETLQKGLDAVGKKPGTKIGEALISDGQVTPKQVSRALRKQVEQVSDATTIRVDTRKLDDMIDMVGELVITQSMVQQDLNTSLHADRNLARDIAQLFRITSGLQRVSTGLRMIPIKQTFQRMSRLVRDLSRAAGKHVAVEMEGEETEIDRTMVDEIYNPLVHMIRNSIDHGLETPADRLRAGKPEKGLIRLSAYHRGGNIVISITDDGRGLNKEKILNKAIGNRVIQTVDGLTDAEVYRLIFLPGLSTAEKVTDISGRGVGMDVVKQAVEKLRGKIEVESRAGEGTSFITSFPLTMAIIDGMIVKVGPERYILPTTAIRQALRPTRESYNNVVGKGETINVMGQLMPLVRLYRLFGIEPEYREPWEAIAVVVEGEDRVKCLLVDKIVGKAEVVIKSLGERFKRVRGISGGAILGDGQVGLIIDPEGLFDISEK
ncbi:MAG: chemotaxis protein CheA [Syntrophales bacterium]|jgi:two-component system chemotaxis sensor kinase CheA|nr:chemotaxis protein CheA [Syntrophales bacterium]